MLRKDWFDFTLMVSIILVLLISFFIVIKKGKEHDKVELKNTIKQALKEYTDEQQKLPK